MRQHVALMMTDQLIKAGEYVEVREVHFHAAYWRLAGRGGEKP